MNSKALAIIPITVALAFMGLGGMTEPVFAYYGGYHGFAYHGALGYHRGFGYHTGFPGEFGFPGEIHYQSGG